MKIGLFSDTHYTVTPPSDRPYLAEAPKRVAEAMAYFAEQKVDVVVCLGDFVDTGADHQTELNNWAALLDEIKKYPTPFYMLPGNHDYEVLKGDEFGKISGMPDYPFAVDIADRKLIFLDACYRENGQRYDQGGMLWTDTNLPDDQIEFLQRTLNESTLPCVVFTHQNLDKYVDKDYHIAHAHKIRRIIRKSKKVSYVFNGHFHAGADDYIRGVRYVTIPSMTLSEVNEYCLFTV